MADFLIEVVGEVLGAILELLTEGVSDRIKRKRNAAKEARQDRKYTRLK